MSSRAAFSSGAVDSIDGATNASAVSKKRFGCVKEVAGLGAEEDEPTDGAANGSENTGGWLAGCIGGDVCVGGWRGTDEEDSFVWGGIKLVAKGLRDEPRGGLEFAGADVDVLGMGAENGGAWDVDANPGESAGQVGCELKGAVVRGLEKIPLVGAVGAGMNGWALELDKPNADFGVFPKVEDGGALVDAPNVAPPNADFLVARFPNADCGGAEDDEDGVEPAPKMLVPDI